MFKLFSWVLVASAHLNGSWTSGRELGARRNLPKISFWTVMIVMCSTNDWLHCREELWLQHTQAFCMANSGIVRLLHRLATWVAELPKRLTGPVPLLLSASKTTDLTTRWQVLQSLPLLALCRYPDGTAAAYLPFPDTECCITECLLATAGREEQEVQQINHDFKCAMSIIILSPALKLEQLYVWKATSVGTNWWASPFPLLLTSLTSFLKRGHMFPVWKMRKQEKL